MNGTPLDIPTLADVEAAARRIAPHALQVLALERERRARERVEGGARQHGRAQRVGRDAARRGLDVGERGDVQRCPGHPVIVVVAARFGGR